MPGIASYVRNGRHTVGVPGVACGVVPEDFTSIVRDLQAVLGPAFDPLVQWAKDWSSVLSCSPTHASQAWWTAAWGSAKHRALLDAAEGRDAARLASQSGGLGTAWMQIVHMDSDSGHIPPDEYRLGLKWALGLPLFPDTDGGIKCPACDGGR